MASRRKEQQEDVRFRVFQILNETPRLTTRELAQKVGISNGSAFYLLTSLIEEGFIKLSSFKESHQKVGCFYLLTPKGIREKSLLTHNFIIRKKKEYKLLKEEISQLEQDVGMYTQDYDNGKSN
jgi:EPS-associated MarR family transcriptional regulator